MEFTYMRNLFFIVATIMLVSCGDGGGTTGQMATSYVTASPTTVFVDADVAKWVDSNGATAPACAATSIPTIIPDSIDVVLSSVPYSNTGANGLKVVVQSISIAYQAADSISPPLAIEYASPGAVIPFNGSVTVPIRVATHERKLSLQSALTCSGTIYHYYATITLHLKEDGSGNTADVSTRIDVRFADFADSST